MGDTNFGKIFNELCEKSGRSNSEIAKILGVDRATIGRWRTGERTPKLSTLPEIAQLFGVDVQIFSFVDNKEELKDRSFPSVEASLRFILEQPMVAAFGGYDLNTMSDEEIMDLADDIKMMIEVATRKYRK